jgi:hypothetical protein
VIKKALDEADEIFRRHWKVDPRNKNIRVVVIGVKEIIDEEAARAKKTIT